MAGKQPTINAKIMKEMPQAMPYDQLLIALAEGKEQAYNQLFQQYWSHIYGVVLSLVKSREQAGDISQEIFTKLYHNRQQLRAFKTCKATYSSSPAILALIFYGRKS